MDAPNSAEAPTSSTVKTSLSHQVFQSLLAVAFPSGCALCGENLSESFWGGACADCWAALYPWTGALCFRCGLPLATTVDSPELVCADCRRGEPRFDFARSYGIYAGRLRTAVLELKFRGRERLGTRLGELLLEPWRALEAAARVAGPVLIIPVPLHRSRERERGYNQARLLAEGLLHAIKLGGLTREVKLDARRLVRSRATSPQSGLSLHARGENVRGVFKVAAAERVRDREVILIDDVMTTGATASACAGALKRAGARQVIVLTLARATPLFPDVAPLEKP